MKYIKGEEATVLGLMLGNVIGVIGHMMSMEGRGKALSILGGKCNIESLKLIAVLAKKH